VLSSDSSPFLIEVLAHRSGRRETGKEIETRRAAPEQSEQKMNKSLCSSRDRLSCARSRDSRRAITLEGKALVTPFGWNIMMKAESEDSARGPAAKPRPAAEMLKL
jgi:hypothetical protein